MKYLISGKTTHIQTLREMFSDKRSKTVFDSLEVAESYLKLGVDRHFDGTLFQLRNSTDTYTIFEYDPTTQEIRDTQEVKVYRTHELHDRALISKKGTWTSDQIVDSILDDIRSRIVDKIKRNGRSGKIMIHDVFVWE